MLNEKELLSQLDNLKDAYNSLEKAFAKYEEDDLQRDGILQRFE